MRNIIRRQNMVKNFPSFQITFQCLQKVHYQNFHLQVLCNNYSKYYTPKDNGTCGIIDIAGADPGFQVRGEMYLKKNAPSGGRRENVWGISCEKSRFYAKKSYFFQFQGGLCRVRPPHWIRPCIGSYFYAAGYNPSEMCFQGLYRTHQLNTEITQEMTSFSWSLYVKFS